MPDITFSQHARLKLQALSRHGFIIQEVNVIETVTEPDSVEEGYLGRKIAQKGLTDTHVLRVVYEEGLRGIRVVTLYPGRRERYEKGQIQ